MPIGMIVAGRAIAIEFVNACFIPPLTLVPSTVW